MRISRHQMFMIMARAASLRSTCYRGRVGAILVDSNNNPRSMGYNGPPSGEEHCYGKDCPLSKSKGCSRSLHAEYNALKRGGLAQENSILVSEDFTLYCTHSPCWDCATDILNAISVKTVIYENEYRIADPIAYLVNRDISVYRLSPSGYLTNKATNEVTEA